MSREIKFRAWNKKHSYFMSDFFIGDDGVVYTESPAFDDYYTEMCEIPFDEVVLQQYTGLKDKNSVEIYEGDILKLDDNYYSFGGNSGEEMRVVFNQGSFALQDNYNPKSFLTFEDALSEIQVIGNIYENKDLLS